MFNIPVPAAKAMFMLRAGGYEAFLVGGCVRDLLMGNAPKDWDITTNAEPTQVKEVFLDFRFIETGLKHGTVTVLIDNTSLEITTFRVKGAGSDRYCLHSVSLPKCLIEDLSRRDFTMNAIAYAPGSGLIDCFGGERDIRSGIIRCVGDPDRRFEEDGLRILRALRFAAVLGFGLDENTAASIHKNKQLLTMVSPERIYTEINKMLCGKAVGTVLRRYADVVCVPIPEITPLVGFEQHNEYHCFDVWRHTIAVVENTPPRSVLRWAALLHDIGKPVCFGIDANGTGHFYGHAAAGKKMADAVMHRLRFDHWTRERILLLIAYHDTPIPAEKKAVKRYLCRFGEEVFYQMIALASADNLGQAAPFRYKQIEYDALQRIAHSIVQEQSCFSLKDLAVNGDDLIKLGYYGKEIGKALSFLLDAVIDENVPNTKDDLLVYVQAHSKEVK